MSAAQAAPADAPTSHWRIKRARRRLSLVFKRVVRGAASRRQPLV